MRINKHCPHCDEIISVNTWAESWRCLCCGKRILLQQADDVRVVILTKAEELSA